MEWAKIRKKVQFRKVFGFFFVKNTRFSSSFHCSYKNRIPTYTKKYFILLLEITHPLKFPKESVAYLEHKEVNPRRLKRKGKILINN